MSGPRPSLNVLVVCTGNVCRSPLAERLLQARCGPLGVTVVSRGCGPAPGVRVPMPIVRAGRALSVDLGDHVVKRLTRHDVETADLVLTATREHRAEVVRMLPQAASRVFTLKEFARVGVELDADDVAANAEDDPLRSLVGSASLLRGSASRPATPDRDDVPDPFGRHRSVHRRAAAEIDAATRSIEAIFSGAVSAACHRPGPSA